MQEKDSWKEPAVTAPTARSYPFLWMLRLTLHMLLLPVTVISLITQRVYPTTQSLALGGLSRVLRIILALMVFAPLFALQGVCLGLAPLCLSDAKIVFANER